MQFILNIHRATKSQSWSRASEDQHKHFRITAKSSFLQTQLLFTPSDSLGQVYLELGCHNAVFSKVSIFHILQRYVNRYPETQNEKLCFSWLRRHWEISCPHCTKVIPKTGYSHGTNDVEFIRRWKLRSLANFDIWTIAFTINEDKSQYITIFSLKKSKFCIQKSQHISLWVESVLSWIYLSYWGVSRKLYFKCWIALFIHLWVRFPSWTMFYVFQVGPWF